MAYLTYAEYQLMGGTLSEQEFIRLEFKARKRIDRLTDSRVQNMASVPEAVKMCMYSVITLIGTVGAEAQATNPTVTSYNTDGYSESYGHSLSVEAADISVDKTIKSDLYGELDDNGVPLLYRGVRV